MFAFSRIDPAQRVEYVVAVNNATTGQPVTVATYQPRGTFERIYPHHR